MKQSDILSFAIDGVQRELWEAQNRVAELQRTLQELREQDEPEVPEGFVPHTEWEKPEACFDCGRKDDIEELKRR